jgi:hypothetical protein
MLSIKSDLVVKTTKEAGEFELVEPLYFWHELTGFQTVPVGFITDFASIPAFFRRIFNVNGTHREEAVVHDWLYKNKGKLPDSPILTRKECDQIFLDGLKKEKIPLWKRFLMYQAIRQFGGIHYKLTSGEWW